MDSGRFLIISDLQIPFEAEKALRFYKQLQKQFLIPDSNILCIGDEVDNLNGGMYPKDPDGTFSPKGEIAITKDKIAQWADAFPFMRICISNHGMRWAKKAAAAEIPSQMIQAYQSILGMPDTWRFQYRWRIDTKHPFQIIHGMEYSGKTPYRLAAEHATISTAFGHLHSSAGLCRVVTMDKNIWAMNVGSTIDRESYAFKYTEKQKFLACLSGGVVLNEGSFPVLVPYE